MKILVWNCQGIGGALTVPNLMEQNKLHSPEVVVLLETKIKGFQLAFLKRKLGMQCMHGVDANGLSGGLIFIWKDPQIVVVAKYSDYYIEVLVTDAHRNVLWHLIAVYASSKDCTREK